MEFLLDLLPQIDNTKVVCPESGLTFILRERPNGYRFSVIDGEQRTVFTLSKDEIKCLWELLSTDGRASL